MQITDVRLRKVNSENRMKAVASVTFDNEFVIHDIKVIESQNGLFIAMPSRKTPNGEKTGETTGKGKFTIVEVNGDWGKLKSGAGYIYLKNASYVKIGSTITGSGTQNQPQTQNSNLPYVVQVTVDALNYHQGPGTNYKINGTIRDKGRYTIVEEKAGWGKLKSGAGWISLAYTKKI